MVWETRVGLSNDNQTQVIHPVGPTWTVHNCILGVKAVAVGVSHQAVADAAGLALCLLLLPLPGHGYGQAEAQPRLLHARLPGRPARASSN
jgi:hypothetical protein